MVAHRKLTSEWRGGELLCGAATSGSDFVSISDAGFATLHAKFEH